MDDKSLFTMAAGHIAALESFSIIAADFRQRCAPYIHSIDEGCCAGDDEISVEFDRGLAALQRAVESAAAAPVVDEAMVERICEVLFQHMRLLDDHAGLSPDERRAAFRRHVTAALAQQPGGDR